MALMFLTHLTRHRSLRTAKETMSSVSWPRIFQIPSSASRSLKIYSLAADARSDMFSTEFNPAAPKNNVSDAIALHPLALTVTDGVGAGNDLDYEQVYLDLPANETKENGRYAIILLTTHIHVLWNEYDKALAVRETFQIPCLFVTSTNSGMLWVKMDTGQKQ